MAEELHKARSRCWGREAQSDERRSVRAELRGRRTDTPRAGRHPRRHQRGGPEWPLSTRGARSTSSAPRPRLRGEVLHIRLRKGSANTARGMLRFCDELIARIARTGARGPKLLRADSGFWSKRTFARLERAGWTYSIGVPCSPMCAPRSSRSTRRPGRPSRTTRRRASPRSPRPRSASGA